MGGVRCRPPHALLSLFPCSSLSQRPASHPHHLLLKQQPQPQQQLAPRPQPPSRWTAPSMARLVSLKAMCWSSSQRMALKVQYGMRGQRQMHTMDLHPNKKTLLPPEQLYREGRGWDHQRRQGMQNTVEKNNRFQLDWQVSQDSQGRMGVELRG